MLKKNKSVYRCIYVYVILKPTPIDQLAFAKYYHGETRKSK
jgi:hypothetical protein